jgi:hypothetical protein
MGRRDAEGRHLGSIEDGLNMPMVEKVDPNRDYLGDGVYCTFDGRQVWIWTSDGIYNSPRIALEPEVFERLSEYYKRMRTKGDE